MHVVEVEDSQREVRDERYREQSMGERGGEWSEGDEGVKN